MLAGAIVLITGALVFYTIGVWSERVQRTLRGWHILFFGLGFACDASGTYLMSQIADESEGPRSGIDTVMAYSGLLALVLMGVHLLWALFVLRFGGHQAKASFHKFSTIVWAIWLVPYFTGAIGAMIS